MNLKELSTEELEQELTRRKAIKEARPKFQHKDEEAAKIAELSEYCNEGLISIEETGCLPKDFKQYVYEMAMEAFFGEDVFEWINKYNIGE